MSQTFNIELSDAEVKGLNYVALDAGEWIRNAVHERCRLAIDELVHDDIQHRMNNNMPITGTREEMALASTLPSGADRNAAAQASTQAMLAAMNSQ